MIGLWALLQQERCGGRTGKQWPLILLTDAFEWFQIEKRKGRALGNDSDWSGAQRASLLRVMGAWELELCKWERCARERGGDDEAKSSSALVPDRHISPDLTLVDGLRKEK
ncbi:hypothetical protein V6N11_060496 [Hibiscus sabdariffa]|uniref:Uncharacterized protein n=1 Tax=Hibiscus sabdariffa TaxID=183260 RepID=A0ABR2QQI4_9ROSI